MKIKTKDGYFLDEDDYKKHCRWEEIKNKWFNSLSNATHEEWVNYYEELLDKGQITLEEYIVMVVPHWNDTKVPGPVIKDGECLCPLCGSKVHRMPDVMLCRPPIYTYACTKCCYYKEIKQFEPIKEAEEEFILDRDDIKEFFKKHPGLLNQIDAIENLPQKPITAEMVEKYLNELAEKKNNE